MDRQTHSHQVDEQIGGMLLGVWDDSVIPSQILMIMITSCGVWLVVWVLCCVRTV